MSHASRPPAQYFRRPIMPSGILSLIRDTWGYLGIPGYPQVSLEPVTCCVLNASARYPYVSLARPSKGWSVNFSSGAQHRAGTTANFDGKPTHESAPVMTLLLSGAASLYRWLNPSPAANSVPNLLRQWRGKTGTLYPSRTRSRAPYSPPRQPWHE